LAVTARKPAGKPVSRSVPVQDEAKYAAAIWDNDKRYCDKLKNLLTKAGFKAYADVNQAKLWRSLRKEKRPVALAMFDMIDQNAHDYKAGLKAVRVAAERYPDSHRIVFSGYPALVEKKGGLPFATQARDAGAHQVLQKGGLDLLRGKTTLLREVWTNVALRQAAGLLRKDGNLDPYSVVQGWVRANDPSGRYLDAESISRSRVAEMTPKSSPQGTAAIDAIYEDLRAQLDADGNVADAGKYDALIANLEALEQAEAARIEQAFEAERPLSADAARAFIARAGARKP
jgi:hypothetical protein